MNSQYLPLSHSPGLRSPIAWCTALLFLAIFLGACQKDHLPSNPPDNTLVFGSERNDLAYGAAELPNGDWLVVGGVENESDIYDVAFLRVDSEGNEVWMRTYPELVRNGYARCITATADGGYAVLLLDSWVYGGTASEPSLLLLGADLEPVANVKSKVIPTVTGPLPVFQGLFPLASGGFVVPYNNSLSQYFVVLDAQGSFQRVVQQEMQRPRVSIGPLLSQAPDGTFLYVGPGTYEKATGYHGIFFDGDFNETGRFDFEVDDDLWFEPLAVLATGETVQAMVYSPDYNNFRLARFDTLQGLRSRHGLSFSEFPFLQRWSGGAFMVAGDSPSGPAGYTSGRAVHNDIVIHTQRISSDGQQTLLVEEFGGENSDRVYDLVPASDGRMLMVGQTQSYGAGGIDIFLTFLEP